MLAVNKLSKSFKSKLVFSEITFNLNPGERVGLIGSNGCGKTTLLRILSGEEQPDSGHFVLTPPNLRIGYLPQGPQFPEGIQLGSLLKKAIDDPTTLEKRLETLSLKLANDPENNNFQNAYEDIINRLQKPSQIGHLSSILAAFELDRIPDEQLVTHLSGGQKTRLSLSLVLLSNPQLLLLDEPTNHLDIDMLEWIESWLFGFTGGALVVSHDRTFLDKTVTRVLAFDQRNATLHAYDGTYSDYIEQVTNEYEKQLANYHNQEKEIRRMKQDIHRTRAQAERTEREASSIRIGGERMKVKGYKDYQQGIAKKVAKKAKSREKKLDRYLKSDERVEKPTVGWQIKVDFRNQDRLGKDVLALQELSIGYPGNPPLLINLNLQVQTGQKIAFTGANGKGKTTLIRTIMGLLKPLHGSVHVGSSVKLGYLDQEQEILSSDLNPVETIQSVSTSSTTKIRNFLHHYLISGDDAIRPISTMSYGERSRLMLARLVAKGCNFLLLDEPINHLDIPSREKFEQALFNFEGTVLAIVHDRFFINRFATEVWKIKGRNILREIKFINLKK
jgi:ATP-binding cassette subfamily F protein 3